MRSAARPTILCSSVKDRQITEDLSRALRAIIVGRSVSVICVGTPKSPWDCLGPLVGTRLQYLQQKRLRIHGTLLQPLHAGHLRAGATELSRERLTLAIDAAIGRPGDLGRVSLQRGPLHPGSGLQKTLHPVGDYHICGVTAFHCRNGGGPVAAAFALVSEMAFVMAEALAWAVLQPI